jgi:2-polyprenyl-3-methyl-5-hydroxy-6-metoxy-1,4-benzoquinol methylase
MSQIDAEKWNTRYSEPDSSERYPIPFLKANIDQLGSGKALVLAAGRGHNAVFLAEQGFDVTALDISDVGLSLCIDLAQAHGVGIRTICADLDEYDLGTAEYALITMIYFYEPTLFPAIRTALNPRGYFLFQTFSIQHATVGTFGPRNPAYLASKSVVTQAFAEDHIVHCDDAILTEDDGTEAVLQMIVQM